MKKRILGLLTALALCLALLPGAALAAETGVAVCYNDGTSDHVTALKTGKSYVATANGVEEWTEEGTPTDPYLSYSGTALTVNGAFELNARLYVYSDLTITGDENASLTVAKSVRFFNSSTLTLDSEVDFTVTEGLISDTSGGPSMGTFVATKNYSGDIVIGSGSQSVAYDVQNSGSIDIQGLVACSDGRSMTLKSAGSITSTDIRLVCTAAELSGQNVTLTGDPVFDGDSLTIITKGDVTITGGSDSAIKGFAQISAGGDLAITSGGVPVQKRDNDSGLTVKAAQNVSITGASDDSTPLISVPVKFENCGEVTVTDTAGGELGSWLEKVTSKTPWTAVTGGESVTLPSGNWAYGGDITNNSVGFPSSATAYQAGEGWVFCEPPAAAGAPATLTLDNAQCPNSSIAVGGAASIEVKGQNYIGFIGVGGPATVNEDGGTLNAIVDQVDKVQKKESYTVYGKATLPAILDLTLEKKDTGEKTLTIPQGAELTIPSGKELTISDISCLKNSGTLVNNGTVTLTGNAAQGDVAGTIKKLGLTGGGKVTVQKTGSDMETYTNSGVRQLTPAGDASGKLDLSADTRGDDKLDSQGYKWEILATEAGTGNVTKAKLTLKEGFNAKTVVLPDATVEIETQGESTIGTLMPPGTIDNARASQTELTLSGEGPLTVQEHINICGGNGNTLTVAKNAVVIAQGGVSVSADALVDGKITVNGTLRATGADLFAAVMTGKITVSGTLEVYGKTGVQLGGWNTGEIDSENHEIIDCARAFTLAQGGRFTGDCEEKIVFTSKYDGQPFKEGLTVEDIIVIPSGYLPQGLERVFQSDGKEALIPGGGPFNISSDNVPRPPAPSHRHAWAEDWTTSETHHWHVCTASGCPITEDSRKDGYEEHVYDGDRDAECNVCGYERTVTRPAPPSEPSDDGGSSSPSSSVGGDSRPTAPVTVEPAEHGEVTSDRARAAYGAPVTLTVQPEKGYELESLTVTDRQGIYMKLSELGGGKYAFTMPGGPVTVRAVFRALGEKRCPSLAFSDLDVRLWYHEATDFVLEAGLMNGYADGTFRPNGTLSRAMLAQILYNRAGRPAVTGGGTFADVDSGAWYAPAVAWAVEQGVADGYADGTFRPDAGITREQLAVMLWRCAGRPADGRALDFADADRAGDYAREALSWAVERGVMSGKSGGVLDPKGAATRAQTAQMLKNQGRNP